MNQIKENIEEATAVKAFRVKLSMARINVMKRKALPEAQKIDSSGHLTGEFDISGLPMPVKKHIITAGIIQGDIFQYGDGFAHIKEVCSPQGKSASSKTLYLLVRALTPKSFEMAIGVVETLLDEVLEPQKKTLKRLTGHRSWDKVLKNEFEIQDLITPVISHLITKGIIKGEIHQSSGAVVLAKGSPYLANDSPQEALSERPIYLLIQGPDEKTLYWAVDGIHKLIKEAEELINNDIPEIIPEERAQSGKVPASCNLELGADENTSIQYPPFMPHLGQDVEADVKRCIVLVHWLLAHPLLVSFMACPPRDCNSKIFSKKMVITALLCLPLYDEYECTHPMPNSFFSEAQKAVTQCCEAVVNRGYDISKLISVDKYVKDLAENPEQIGVLYDYPLPLNLFYMDRCRLFIDLAINCGFEIKESQIESYLRSTKLWYPVEAFRKLVSSRIRPCPSKNQKTHQYPLYCSVDHNGGLINFHLKTLGNSSTEQWFPADAQKIPMCKYFPFLHRLSVFSNLKNYNKSCSSIPNSQTVEMYGSISLAAYQLTRESLNNSERNVYSPPGSLKGSQQNFHPVGKSVSMAHPTMSLTTTESSKQPSRRLRPPEENYQNLTPDNRNESSKHHLQASTSFSALSDIQNLPTSSQPQLENEKPTQEILEPKGSLPPSFLTMRGNTLNIQNKQTSAPNRILKKQIRKEMLEKKKEEKREEINKTIEMLKKKHGKNSFWTVDSSELAADNAKEKLSNLLVSQTNSFNLHFATPQPQTPVEHLVANSMFPQNLQQALSSMQMTMPAMQPTLFGAQPPMVMRQDSKPILKPPLLNAEQILESQQHAKDDSQLSRDGSQSNPFSEVISKLQEYIQATGEKKTDGIESGGPSTVTVDEDRSARLQQSQKPVLHSTSTAPVLQETPSIAQLAASDDNAVDSPFSSIIQQLKQYIDSNSQASSQGDLEIKMPPADPFKKPLEPTVSKKTEVTHQTPKVDHERKQESSQLKRASTDPISESTQPKRLYMENSTTKPITSGTKPTTSDTKPTTSGTQPNTSGTKPTTFGTTKPTTSGTKPTTSSTKPTTSGTKPTTSGTKPTTSGTKPTTSGTKPTTSGTKQTTSFTKPTTSATSFAQQMSESILQKSGPRIEAHGSQKPCSSVPKNIVKQAKIISEVSILGDSLLQRARERFGGSANQDRRNDWFTVKDLKEDLVKFHNAGGKLRPYCLVMVGVNDVINLTPPKVFVQHLKYLLNYLLSKGYYVLLATLPTTVSNMPEINKTIPNINGLILSFHTKPNLSIIHFHKMFQITENRRTLLKSIHIKGQTKQSHFVVLSDLACKLIREMIENDVLVYI